MSLFRYLVGDSQPVLCANLEVSEPPAYYLGTWLVLQVFNLSTELKARKKSHKIIS